MDLHTAGIVIQILNLMAISDGHVAPEEKDLLTKLTKRYLKDASIPSWAAAFDHPNDIEKLAEEIPSQYRQLTVKLAYMVIIASREAYQFEVNSDERQSFERLCDHLGINEKIQIQLMAEARNDLLKRPSPWDTLNEAFSALYPRRGG